MMAVAFVFLVVPAVRGSQLLGLGDTVLVWANAVRMALQAPYGWFFKRYCDSRRHPNMIKWISRLLPSLLEATPL